LKENARDSEAIEDAEKAVKNLHEQLDNIKFKLSKEMDENRNSENMKKIYKEILMSSLMN